MIGLLPSFKGLETISEAEVLEALDLPADWLEKLAEKHLTPEERAAIEALGGFDKLMETLKQRLAEQKGPSSGRQQVDRHGGHLAFWRLWLQPRRRADRAR